jgi:Rrf2 family nitric oxide-sensitive transcriptional repressor
MRLTSFTDYSLRVLMYLAADPDRRATIAEIARAYAISQHHLVKVVHSLGRAGVLANVRGRGGGIELARPPEAINVGAVVRATEGPAMPAECFAPESNACRIARACRLQAALRDAAEAFLAVLDGYTLADLTRNRAALARVLHIAPAAAATRNHRP